MNILLQSSQDPAEILLFFGRFHPLIVHLPIGILFLAFLMEWGSRYYKKLENLKPAIPFVILLGAITATLAVIAGYLLSLGGGYNDNTLSLHMWLGIIMTLLTYLAYAIKADLIPNWKPPEWAFPSLLTVTFVLLMVTGHMGGNLTHGSDYLTRYMPDPIRKVAGLGPGGGYQRPEITNIDSAEAFTHIVEPILQERCVSCHNNDKQKGELLLTTREMIMQGGESGEIIIPGNPEESDFFERITLPEDHDDHMPPEGKKQLNDDQIDYIKWWIENGAPFDKKVAQLEVNDEMKEKLFKLTKEGQAAQDPFNFAKNVEPANTEELEKLRDSGISILPLAQKENLLKVQVTNVQKSFDDEALQQLEPFNQQITWLDLSHSQITDNGLETITNFPNLTKLHLQNTAVTDNGLENLQSLEHLRYLNLYSTDVTNDGIQHLAGVKSLQSLYLWQTRVDSTGIQQLQEQKPELKIVGGIVAAEQETGSQDSVKKEEGEDGEELARKE